MRGATTTTTATGTNAVINEDLPALVELQPVTRRTALRHSHLLSSRLQFQCETTQRSPLHLLPIDVTGRKQGEEERNRVFTPRLDLLCTLRWKRDESCAGLTMLASTASLINTYNSLQPEASVRYIKTPNRKVSEGLEHFQRRRPPPPRGHHHPNRQLFRLSRSYLLR